jgi:hypothetical protein
VGVGCQHHDSTAVPWEIDPVPIVQESEWAPGQVWTGAENLASSRIRSQDRPARSESLYRLSYSGPLDDSQEAKVIFYLWGQDDGV